MKNISKKLVSKTVSKKVLGKNSAALKFYNHYRKAFDIIERADIALGRKPTFKADTNSTLNIKVNHYGISSTTT